MLYELENELEEWLEIKKELTNEHARKSLNLWTCKRYVPFFDCKYYKT